MITIKHRFLRLWFCHFISATKICYWWISAFYRAPNAKAKWILYQWNGL